MTGCEWIVEGHGCTAASLCDVDGLARLFDAVVADLSLRPVQPPVWHVFPGAGGITGLLLLAESHLTCHTFPEYGSICVNLFCCRPRPEWDFQAELAVRFGAQRVTVRRLDRPYGAEPGTAESVAVPEAPAVTMR